MAYQIPAQVGSKSIYTTAIPFFGRVLEWRMEKQRLLQICFYFRLVVILLMVDFLKNITGR